MPRELKCECNKPSCSICYKRNWIRLKREKIRNEKSQKAVEDKSRLSISESIQGVDKSDKLETKTQIKAYEEKVPPFFSEKVRRIRRGESKILFGLPSEGSRIFFMSENGETVEAKDGDGQQRGFVLW